MGETRDRAVKRFEAGGGTMTGAAAQLRRMRDLAVQTMHERDPDALHPLVLAELLRACDAEAAVCKESDWRPDEGAMSVATVPAARSEFDHPQARRLIRLGRPFAEHYTSTGDSSPRPADALGRLQHLRDVRRFAPGRRFAFGIPLPGAYAPVRGYVLFRPDAVFGPAALAYGIEVQPLLVAVDRQRILLSQWRAGAAAVSSGCHDCRAPVPADAAPCGLTPRETTVLLLLADALTTTAIGRRLGISARTVNKHIERIYRKLGTRDRLSTVHSARLSGLLSTPCPSHRES
ncbi:helix-turn-helix transcriptional regulator [Streptomyces sp. JV184]|uniref:helix-turn-helix transcriptional regulator n=1 Tax=Streptomyces sp. JV184 TaxID=858637 RepID=UPI002E797BF1|nr:helix-turn-helix transcriptional regulator [Streptomyces sp. JV184]MEE1748402.1 helix-turn-helix transcriptional regulator [Streptomyces sp. JV184]MEE1748475.1 helix-turn-helix transcriptional regulator [Streptomyces sp. JV184]